MCGEGERIRPNRITGWKGLSRKLAPSDPLTPEIQFHHGFVYVHVVLLTEPVGLVSTAPPTDEQTPRVRRITDIGQWDFLTVVNF